MPKGTTKKKATEKLREVEDQLRRGIYLPDQKVPTFKQVAENWLEYKKLNIRNSTWRKYEGYINNHFDDLLKLKVNRITTARVEKFITNKQKQGMNLTTLRKIISAFNQIMKYAVRHNFIDYNPVRDAERPADQSEVIETDEHDDHIQVLKPESINAFLEAQKNQKYYTLFMLAIFSGARQGELFGLKWTDVDWFNHQIHIQRTFNEGAWYKPKSKASKRRIDLGANMMAQLRKWMVACPPNELDLVFPNESGKPLHHGNMLRRHFYPALKKANIPRIRFHDLRHTYASLLIEQGENIKYVQNQLGHASPMVTLTVYAHLMNPANKEAASRLEKTIFENNGSKMVAKNKKGITHDA